jgi:hypothetical protein
MLAYPMLNKERLWTELCPLWEETISSSIQCFKSRSNNNKQWAPKFPF